ncbi:MAG: alpha/beta fold hydrolase [Thermoplasmata archaeon]|nr:alpha/beta fold hydrolase [Thermoplasmata archaeon]MCI4341043.1 alpha/beta fold hydrolase [Thermoplasmata archaeon]
MPADEDGAASLYVREAGSGSTVLLLHGLGSDHTVWNGILPVLAEEHTVLAPDLRGHGRSPTPEGSTFGFDEMEADLEQLLAERKASPVHVVGLSAGAFLATRLAVDRTSQLRSLVSIAGASHCDAHTRAVAENWARTYHEAGFELYVQRLLRDVYSPGWLEGHMDLVDKVTRQLRDVDLRGPLQWYSAIRSFDVRGSLGRLRLPTLVVHGMDDRVIDPTHARLLRQSILGAELKLYPYAGHMVPVEQGEETGRLLKDWLSRVDAVAAKAPPG